jgi:integrase
MSKLTALSVRNAKPGRHADGAGLYLLVKPTGGRSWLLRVQVGGKRRDVGLGTADTSPRSVGKGELSPIKIPILERKVLTLSEAREKAGMLRIAAKSGLDPVVERDRERNRIPKFSDAAKSAHEALKDGWAEKGAKTFLASLENHAFAILGNIRVDAITSADITSALAPIWTTKPDMARKVRERIGTVLNFAHGKGWRTTEAPRHSVTVELPRQPKAGNYEAMPFADLPAFVAAVDGKAETIGRLALLFTIFTAARSGEVRQVRWSHIDLDRKLWNRPAELMKSRLPHSITLNAAAMAVLERAKAHRTGKEDPLIFPNSKANALSDMTLSKIMRDAKSPYTVHGFRSSFRDWAAEMMPEIPDPVAEAALAHGVPDKVVRAYKRTDFLEMRRRLLDGWSVFLSDCAVKRQEL